MKFLTYPGKFRRFASEIATHTPLIKMSLLLVTLWLAFSTGMLLVERDAPGSHIVSLSYALYWGVTAFSTAGISSAPVTPTGQLLGGAWIVIGSMLFFGTLVSTVTAYFMRPMQRPAKRIINTIEYNLEQLDDLTLDELDLLKETVNALIEHVELIKQQHQQETSPETAGTQATPD